MPDRRTIRLTARPGVRRRAGRTVWAALGFMLLFAGLIVFVSYRYLLPALSAAQVASPGARKHLAADALLIMSVLLVILFCGLLLTFRPGRFFFPRPTRPRTQTRYVDAWAEAGRRAAAADVAKDAPPDEQPYG